MENGFNLQNSGKEMTDLLKQKLIEARDKMGHANIVIVGKTGVGKSTLINTCFGSELTKTGTGAPVTKGTKLIEKEGFPLRIYDTEGLELDEDQQKLVENGIVKIIQDKQLAGKPDEMIHFIWYCIAAVSDRIDDKECQLINELHNKFKNIPIIIILTKSYGNEAEELKKYIEKQYLKVDKIFCVLAKDYIVNNEYTVHAKGCDKVIDYVLANIEKSAADAFLAAQKVSLEKKREKAMSIISVAAVTAFGEGFAPIPFSDAALLVPTQVAMIAAITAAYGANIEKSTMKAIFTSLFGTTATTYAGKTIVSNLLKCIPGFGTGVGGAISGTTAATLTFALGKAYIAIMDKLIRGEISESQFLNKNVRAKFNQEYLNILADKETAKEAAKIQKIAKKTSKFF